MWIKINSLKQCIRSQPMAKIRLRKGDLLLRVPQVERESPKEALWGAWEVLWAPVHGMGCLWQVGAA